MSSNLPSQGNQESQSSSSLTLTSAADLRKALNKNTPKTLETTALQHSFTSLAQNLLSSDIDVVYEETKTQLTNLYDSLQGVFDYAQVPQALQDKRFINKTGMATSPKHTLSTIKDVYRVSAFVKAIDKAVTTLNQKFDEKLHIVYPACGPLAPLLMPLLMYYKTTGKYTAEDLHVTFIDIQEGAVLALKEVLQVGGLNPFIKDILLMDAVDFELRPNEKVHMLVLEAMQHGFSREGHLAIALHFNKLLTEGGLLVPEEVRVNAFLANPQKEFVEQWKDIETGFHRIGKSYQEQRIELGNVLTINRDTLEQMQLINIDEHTKLLECHTIQIPEYQEDREQRILLFSTEVDVYDGEQVREYDSGITHPLPDMSICINFKPKDQQDDDLLLVCGDTVTFYYRLNGSPGFLVTKEE